MDGPILVSGRYWLRRFAELLRHLCDGRPISAVYPIDPRTASVLVRQRRNREVLENQ